MVSKEELEALAELVSKLGSDESEQLWNYLRGLRNDVQFEVWASRNWEDFIELRGKYLTLSAIIEFREIKLEELMTLQQEMTDEREANTD